MLNEQQHAHRLRHFEQNYIPEPNSGCWLWTGYCHPTGYGLVGGGKWGTKWRAHRFAYEAFIGPIPDGMFVCHRCDVPSCVNPDHLFVGSNADNVQDMVSKGRHFFKSDRFVRPRGEQINTAKLTENQVLEIRELVKTNSCAAVSRMFGVSEGTILNIANGRSWRHLLPEGEAI